MFWKKLSVRKPEREARNPGTHVSSLSTLTLMSGTTNMQSMFSEPLINVNATENECDLKLNELIPYFPLVTNPQIW